MTVAHWHFVPSPDLGDRRLGRFHFGVLFCLVRGPTFVIIDGYRRIALVYDISELSYYQILRYSFKGPGSAL